MTRNIYTIRADEWDKIHKPILANFMDGIEIDLDKLDDYDMEIPEELDI